MIIFRLGEIWRLCARYRFAIAGTILGAQFVFPLQGLADFSSANFARIWKEEISSKLPQTQQLTNHAQLPTNSSSVPLGTLPSPSLLVPQSIDPHPAVVRVVVPEGDATSFGSGTLVDVREQYGLVITNWHVVRDAQGPIDVIFPNGRTSKARALKVDPDWDLAALVIWHPQVEPVKIAATAPQPGDRLTICGYGPGVYRSATGRCTQYYSPKVNMPQQMVELDVEARQGDSGGPIFNDRGELAGVLFGAGEGTTLGSFGGRVESFLATLAPNIGHQVDAKLPQEAPLVSRANPKATINLEETTQTASEDDWQSNSELFVEDTTKNSEQSPFVQNSQAVASRSVEEKSNTEEDSLNDTDPKELPNGIPYTARQPLFEQVKTALAAIGLVALAVMVLKAAG